MSARNCVTHHHACDCREAAHNFEVHTLKAQHKSALDQIAELKAENEKLRVALEKIVLHIPTIGETGRALTQVKDIARVALGDEK